MTKTYRRKKQVQILGIFAQIVALGQHPTMKRGIQGQNTIYATNVRERKIITTVEQINYLSILFLFQILGCLFHQQNRTPHSCVLHI